MNSDTPMIRLKGVGEKSQMLFRKLDISTVGELLAHYPRDYERFEDPVTIAQAAPGQLCTLRLCVVGVPSQKLIRNLNILNVNVRDATGSMQLTFFNMPFMKKLLKSGGYYLFRGRIMTRGAVKIMEQPRLYSQEEYRTLQSAIQPRYALTKGLTNQTVQKCVRQALSLYAFEEEYYPRDILEQYKLISHKEAVEGVHFPENEEVMRHARRRLVFEEFFEFLWMLRQNKALSNDKPNDYPMVSTDVVNGFLEAMPFSLTKAQQKVWQEIWRDLSGPYSMNRLIQGDVGSGKTIVAVLALLACVEAGYQGAMMAPTEVLAAQHYETICQYITTYQLPFVPQLLVGSMSAFQKRKAYERIASGEVNLVIGTHAVIQEKVQFCDLALVITDEQHRFGVRQREILAGKGELTETGPTDKPAKVPHVLVMSATPIPRTLAIILYGDLHLSVIDELPADRLPIKNCVVGTSYRPKAYEFITKQVREGRQAYVICPMVEEGELEETENVVEYAQKLRASLPSDIVIEPLHGKMPPARKNQLMEAFSRGEIHVLVSTTVIEVGINVPNATVMMVENAERFGLAQLHQLRGRVGRGRWQSYCIFISANEKPENIKRLEVLNQTNDGFRIASEDLKLRGPGELFGVRQSGDLAFQIGDIYADAEVLQAAEAAVTKLLKEDVQLTKEENLPLRKHLERTRAGKLDFRTI